MKDIDYSHHFVGHVVLNDVGRQFIKDARKVLKGSGFTLWARGRNPNRKQFAGQGYYTHHMLRSTIPIRFASYVGLYLRSKNFRTWGTPIDPHLAGARGRVDAVKEIYKNHNINVFAK
jgi:hypothetical protein